MNCDLIYGFLEGLRPTPSLTVWEWADKYRMLSSVSSAEAGRWRTDRVPYMREIFTKLSPDDPCQEVVLMKGVQISGTEAALNCVGAYIDLEPCPIMYVMPTVDMAKGLSKKRLHHMISECPTLAAKVTQMNRREGSSSLLEKFYAGGALTLTGANSAAGLRSQPIRVLILDETDAYPLNIDGEGSPIKLAEARTTTYSKNRKIFKLSTPTDGNSVIAFSLEGTDKNRYHVPCRKCGLFQHLVFANLKWPKGQPTKAVYECEGCGHGIEENRNKTFMLNEGNWIPSEPDYVSKYKAGYMINSLYSPLGWMSWAQIATKFLAEKDDTILFRTFINTVLGEPWQDRGDAPEWENIYNKRTPYAMNQPNDNVMLITAGCDVQKDRLEVEIVGWCKDKSTYSIDYRVLQGDTSERAVWDSLAEVVNEKWIRPDGIELPLMMLAVDSGYNTQFVYDFCRRFDVTRVIPVKGQDSQRTIVSTPRSIDVSAAGKAIGKMKVWNVGVSVVKSEIYSNLRLNKNEDGTYPPNYCHFPEYGVEYFKGITSEQLVFRMSKGFRKYEWEKVYTRNEPLDCRVYARAAATVVGIDRFNENHWDVLIGRYNKRKEGHAKPISQKVNKPKQKSSFWGDR